MTDDEFKTWTRHTAENILNQLGDLTTRLALAESQRDVAVAERDAAVADAAKQIEAANELQKFIDTHVDDVEAFRKLDRQKRLEQAKAEAETVQKKIADIEAEGGENPVA